MAEQQAQRENNVEGGGRDDQQKKKSPGKWAEEWRKSMAELRNGILVGAALVAALAFQAAITPPGGFWQDDLIVAPDNTLQKNHTAGSSIWRDKCPSEYRKFWNFNKGAFALSAFSILLTALSAPANEMVVSVLSKKWISPSVHLIPAIEFMSAIAFIGSGVFVTLAFLTSMHQQGA